MTRFHRPVWLAAIVAGFALAHAQEPLNPPSPLAAPPATASLAGDAVTLTTARSAHEIGMPTLAAELYRQVRLPAGAEQTALSLKLVSALLEAGQPDEATAVLNAMPPPRSAAWHLRAGLAAMQAKNVEAARAALLAIREPELPESEHPWYWFLQGAFVDMTAPDETNRSNNFYQRAEGVAPNELARARFQLAAEHVRIMRGTAASPDEMQAARQSYERQQGTLLGYLRAQAYALMLMGAGQKSEAMSFLQLIIPPIPPTEQRWWDDLRLTLGVIGDRGASVAGRKALTELLEAGHDPKRQRQALQMLWEASDAEPARSQFRSVLDRLIGGPAKHPIKESLLYFRAHLALLEKDHERAIAGANALLTEFPGSELRLQTYGLLTKLAWEQRRYRSAADSARKARAQIASLSRPEQSAAAAELGVVEAEAWYRAGLAGGDKSDFRNAADAYAASLQTPPTYVKPGDLIFQRVLAEIKSESGNAVRVLDELAGLPTFDLENRWQAEWSLARALSIAGKTGEALARVNALTESAGASAAAIKPDLRVRLVWLRARLSLDAGNLEQTLSLVDALLEARYEIASELMSEIASTALLMKATAQFQLGREQPALQTLARVRADFAKSEAAAESYLVEADFYAGQGQIVEGKKRLTILVEDPAYQGSKLIPHAFLQLALWSEKLGQKKDLEEANAYIEKLAEFVSKRPNDPALDELSFVARMKQGDLFRRLNMFPQAQQVYEYLERRPASVENQILARLQLARTHHAQATDDPAHADRAQLLYEELRDRADAWSDVRVEAGYLLGALLVSRGKLDQAAKVWWEDVATRFLGPGAPAFEPGAKRPWWLARTLVDLGALLVRQGRLEDAKKAYALITQSNLGSAEDQARSALSELGVNSARP